MLAVLVAIVAVIAVAVAAFFLYGREQTWALIAGNPDLGPFERTAPARSPRPNDALLCTQGLCDGVKVDAQLPDYAASPEELIASIDAAIRDLGIPVRRVDDGSDPTRARYVTWSPLMRFPDTNAFEAVPLDDGRTGLVAYARAQLGYSDGGANLKRLQAVTLNLGN
ncbi:DUF1499 domain-containing protein [Oricola sp.]|uniref:DUF1499 domain-containing protein n=1 Tax=Oricola sp. TaxID=1979950 RepID=UPI0025D47EB9|nr:DUF1499 domain-containing protein [Oricola sp.]MCI5074296.1 DUF1499 domain-containing protein [Oricola sp.]